MEILVDRSRNDAAVAIGTTWVLFCIAFLVSLLDNHDSAETEPLAASDLLLGGLLGACLVVIGFAATSRCRPRLAHAYAQRLKLAVTSLGIGFGVGTVSLAALLGLAKIDKGIRAQLTWPISEPLWQPLFRAFGAAVVEEVACRLFLMGVVAWIAARYARRRDNVFPIALYTSALVFGLFHGPDFSAVALALVLLNTLAGVVLGWLFWRWGLTHAVLCHFAAGVIIQGIGPRLVG